MIRHHIATFEYTAKYNELGFIHQIRIICTFSDEKYEMRTRICTCVYRYKLNDDKIEQQTKRTSDKPF